MENKKSKLEILQEVFADQNIVFSNEERADFVEITPEMAETILGEDINSSNRGLTQVTVMSLIKLMEANEWLESTGEPIKFSADGTLINGQHRLAAVAKSGKTYKFLVVSGLKTVDFKNLDTSKKLNATDLFKMIKIKDPAIKSSGITFYFVIQKNCHTTEGLHRGRMGIANEDILDEYLSRPKFWDDASELAQILSYRITKILKPSFIMGWYAALSDINKEKAKEFINALCTGEDVHGCLLDDTHVITRLRRILYENTKYSDNNRNMPMTLRNAYLVKTWDLFLQGKNPLRLSVKTGENIAPLHKASDTNQLKPEHFNESAAEWDAFVYNPTPTVNIKNEFVDDCFTFEKVDKNDLQSYKFIDHVDFNGESIPRVYRSAKSPEVPFTEEQLIRMKAITKTIDDSYPLPKKSWVEKNGASQHTMKYYQFPKFFKNFDEIKDDSLKYEEFNRLCKILDSVAGLSAEEFEALTAYYNQNNPEPIEESVASEGTNMEKIQLKPEHFKHFIGSKHPEWVVGLYKENPATASDPNLIEFKLVEVREDELDQYEVISVVPDKVPEVYFKNPNSYDTKEYSFIRPRTSLKREHFENTTGVWEVYELGLCDEPWLKTSLTATTIREDELDLYNFVDFRDGIPRVIKKQIMKKEEVLLNISKITESELADKILNFLKKEGLAFEEDIKLVDFDGMSPAFMLKSNLPNREGVWARFQIGITDRFKHLY